MRLAGLFDVLGHAGIFRRTRREPGRAIPLQTASGYVWHAWIRLGSCRPHAAEIRQDAAAGLKQALSPVRGAGAPTTGGRPLTPGTSANPTCPTEALPCGPV